MPETITMDLPNVKTTVGLDPKEMKEVPSVEEKKVEAPPAPEPKKESDGSRFAALAKKEKGLVLKANDLKVKEGRVAEKESALLAREEKVAQIETLKKDFATNPLKALEYLGISYKELTDFILKGEKPTPELVARSVDQKLSDWEKRQEEKEKAAEAKRQKDAEEAKKKAEDEHAQAWQGWIAQVDAFVKNDKDRYELTNLNEASHLVVATIQEHYEKTLAAGKPEVLSTEQAADKVEKFLEERVKANNAAKKFQKQVEAKETPEPKQAEKPTKEAPPRTLTNTMTSSAPSLIPAKTEQDRIQRALAALSKAG